LARYTYNMKFNICFVSSEVAPLAKTGGLADVSGALPKQLHDLGHDVRVFMPLYATVDRTTVPTRIVEQCRDVQVWLGSLEYRFTLMEAALPGSRLPIFLIDCPSAYDRTTLYTNGEDEHLRFLLLQRAALEACQRLKFSPHIIHCNDWHTGLMPLILKTQYAWDRLFAHTKTLMSIHNIGYQGHFAAGTLGHAGLSEHAALLDSYDLTRGRVNWLKEGIRHADRVSTVSPTYAQEICTPLGGHGLDGALRTRGDVIAGILNGVDYREWNPATDTLLPKQYSATDLSGKAIVKQSLLARMHLPARAETPLIGCVSRLTPQKGFDLLFDVLPELLSQREFALTILGSGELRYEQFFADLAKRFPDRVSFQSGYSEELAHWIEAGADMFLMPSMYEPCGLNQMYSLKYGTVPIVRRTGGLADSVHMWNATTHQGTGIVFNDFDGPAVRWALHTALDLFKNRAAWNALVKNGMAADYSWEQQTHHYVSLYREMQGKSAAAA
jgi:starch synthase